MSAHVNSTYDIIGLKSKFKAIFNKILCFSLDELYTYKYTSFSAIILFRA